MADSGPGIDADHLGLIFDRGFSTKPADAAGRGFGLAVVREILARRGGAVEVSTPDPTGARFVARWPVSDGGPT